MKRLKRKNLLLLAKKLIEKVIPDPCNTKKHNESFLRKKNMKSVKLKSDIIANQPKTFDTADIKSVIIEHPKTSYELSKTIRQAEKVGSNSSLYSKTKKSEKFLNEKNVKITKQEHAFKGYASTYKTEILNSFNLELQLKDTESAIKSQLIELLTHLKGFKFVITLVLVFKNTESEDKTKYDQFDSKAEIITNENESDIDDMFKSIYTTVIRNTYNIQDKKNIQDKVQAGLLIQSLIILLVFQSIILQLEAVI